MVHVWLSAAFCLLAYYASYSEVEILGIGISLLAFYHAFMASETLGKHRLPRWPR